MALISKTNEVQIVYSTKCDGSSKIVAMYLPSEKAFIDNEKVVPLTTFFNDIFARHNSGEAQFQVFLAVNDFKRLYEEAIECAEPIYDEGTTVWRKTWNNGRNKYETYLVGPIIGYMMESCKYNSNENAERAIMVVREFTRTSDGIKEGCPEANYKPMGDLATFKTLDKVIKDIKKALSIEGVLGVQIAAAGQLYTA